ncbi:unnamed protein product [Choristocarpus tenellus]
MKTVALTGIKTKKAFDFILREVDVLRGLDHPNIVRLQASVTFRGGANLGEKPLGTIEWNGW